MAKKFKFSQNDLKDFFRDHIEKVIMGVAAIMLGWFLWNAISVKPTTTRTPTELQQLAASTKNFLAEDSWPLMAEYRKADTTAPDRIRAAAENVAQVDAYQIGMVAGPLVKDAELRLDPELLPASELIARPITVAIFHKPGEGKASPLILQRDSEKLLSDNRDQEKSKKNKDKDQDKEKDSKEPPKSMGDSYEVIHSMEDWGVRGASVANMVPSVETVVAVVGLVPIENQWKRFDAALRRSRGYYPDRDRPTYLYLQIARQVEGEEWEENYEKVIADYEERNFGAAQAPEIIDPKYYDNVLTRPFPPVSAFDFRDVARHPKVPLRRTVPSFLWIKETGDQLVPFRGDKSSNKDRNKGEGDKAENPDEQSDSKAKDPKREELERLKGSSKIAFEEAVNSKTPLAPHRMVRFVDYDPPLDKRVRYRVRLWLLDSNDPPDSIDAIGKKNERDKPNVGMGFAGDDEGPNAGAKKDSYRKQPVTAQMIHPSVAERLRRKLESFDELPDQALRNAVPTDWSPETEFVEAKMQIPAEVYLGAVRDSATINVGNARIPRDEPTANVAASYISPDFGVRVAAPKQANRGDLMNFSISNLGIVEPATQEVVKLNQAQVKSNLLMVDIQGGSELNLNEVKEIKTQTENTNSVEGFEALYSKFTDPGEILVMDENGKFKVQNSSQDYRFYRSRLLLPDETLEHGKPPEKEDDKRGGRRGAPPGGAGGGGGDTPGG